MTTKGEEEKNIFSGGPALGGHTGEMNNGHSALIPSVPVAFGKSSGSLR